MSAHFLVVDDEPINLEIIQEYLEGSGYTGDFHTSPTAAWSALEATPEAYDMILLDRMMPELDGMAFLRRMKSEVRFQQVPVVMQTAACSPQQIREGLEAGAYYYLTKPYERDSLLAIVRAALADGQQRRELLRQEAERWQGFKLLRQGVFEISDLSEASQAAAFIAQACPLPDTAQLGISELLINAIEHGNLGITYAEKAQLKREDSWGAELLRRAELAENRGKVVTLTLRREDHTIIIRIEDQGQGFDWTQFLEFSPERAFDPNGRGIALARMMSFSSLTYLGCGNIVVATISQPQE